MIRIIFVDDELNVLQAMRRSLHAMRSEWNMDFVSGGAEALSALKASPADVIVSDMRMPGMDGWQLLTEVRKLYPQTVRLILSGHAEATSIMRAVGMAHQYLAKPCESAAIKSAIVQTLKLRNLVSNDQLVALVGQVSAQGLSRNTDLPSGSERIHVGRRTHHWPRCCHDGQCHEDGEFGVLWRPTTHYHDRSRCRLPRFGYPWGVGAGSQCVQERPPDFNRRV
jgi:YesN/AraC family two-component response regulator